MKTFFTFSLYFFLNFLYAQENDTINYYNLTLEELMQIEITTASKISQKATDAPVTVYVVTDQQIKFRGYSCLLDLLEDIPQVEIQRKSRSQWSNIISMNGVYGSEKFIILMDGVRVNSSTGTPHTIGESYPLFSAKQVEIILGPASSLYGADAFTGIINIITKKAYENKNLHLSASYGSFNSMNSAFSYGIGNEDISFNLTGKLYHSDEPYLPDLYKDEYNWYEQNYKPSGEMTLFGDTVKRAIRDWGTPTKSYFLHGKLNVKNFEVGSSFHYESHSNSIGSPPNTYIYSDKTVYTNHIFSAYVRHQFQSDNEKLQIHSNMSMQEFKVYPESMFLNQYANYDPAYKYEHNTVFKLEEQISYSFNESFILLSGFSIENINALPKTSDLPFKIDESLSLAEQNVYYPGTNIYDQDSNYLAIYQDFYQLRYKNIGGYIQLQKVFLEHFSLTAGLRYDYNTRYNPVLNPRLGLVYNKEKITFKLLYGTAYLAPSPYKSYQHYGSFYSQTDSLGNTNLASSYWHLPNKDLEAEKRQSYEFYTLYKAHENLLFAVNVYFSKIDNLIDSENFENQYFHNILVSSLSKAVNKGDAITYGMTFKLDYNHKISNASSLDFFGAYTYSDGELNDDILPLNAKHTIKTGLGWNYKDKFSIFTKVLYRSKSHHRTSTKENEKTNEAFTYVNLYTKYEFYQSKTFQSSIFMNIKNVLNSKFYHAGGEIFTQTPQDPIKIMFGVNVDF